MIASDTPSAKIKNADEFDPSHCATNLPLPSEIRYRLLGLVKTQRLTEARYVTAVPIQEDPMLIMRRLVVMVATCGIALFAALSLSGTASAAPYPIGTPAVAVSTDAPVAGEDVTLTFSGFAAGESVVVDLGCTGAHLATVTADANGDATATVTIPDGLTGACNVTASGVTSGTVATTALTIQAAAAAAAASTSAAAGVGTTTSGGLANTGAIVAGAGILAVLLLVGGGAFVIAGRRRNSNSSV
jgi:hypothetical protein